MEYDSTKIVADLKRRVKRASKYDNLCEPPVQSRLQVEISGRVVALGAPHPLVSKGDVLRLKAGLRYKKLSLRLLYDGVVEHI